VLDASPEAQSSGPIEVLTPRERQVLEMVSLGLTNVEIARRLEVTEHAIKFHLSSIFRKLGVGNRTGAAMIYMRTLQAGEI
jgi:NarL family two-component system response regulator YdfI